MKININLKIVGVLVNFDKNCFICCISKKAAEAAFSPISNNLITS